MPAPPTRPSHHGKHRAPTRRELARSQRPPRRRARRTVVTATVTGGALVGAGLLATQLMPGSSTQQVAQARSATSPAAVAAARAAVSHRGHGQTGRGGAVVSRSQARTTLTTLADMKQLDLGKDRAAARHHNDAVVLSDQVPAQPATSGGGSGTSGSSGRGTVVTSGDPRTIAQSMLASFGWSSSEFSCLDPLWMGESGWNPRAENVSSGAYGIPQALPGDKMASAGADWATNPATQIKWGLGYIKERYGSPCGAWSYHEAHGYY